MQDLFSKKCIIRSYDILQVWWTHINFKNILHYKIEFAISLWTNK